MGKLKSVGRYIMEDRTLGKGNFAVVELASHIITNNKVAVKIIDRRKLKEEYMQQNLYREAKVMSKLRHPNIVRLYETIKAKDLYFLVTEYVAGGDLLSYVRHQKEGFLSESRSRVYVRQLVSALHHLHERGVVHRDLKMENIILDEKRKNLKLIDFGLSNTYSLDQLLKTHCGSPEYAAPELFVTGRAYGPEVDIWSLGVIVYAMVTGKLPFTAPHTENRRQRLLTQINAGLGHIHERDMREITEDCKDLLRQSIKPSETRIHLLDIQIHPWITSNGKDTFYTFQQPPRDPHLKGEVLQKMASLLNVGRSTLDGKIHETRCDEIGAIFNLLMDDALRERGLWEGDHTRRRGRTRRSTSGRETVRSKSQTPTGEHHPVRLRTPTIVGMVRPSNRPSRNDSPLQAVDFELSVVESDKQTPERPRTASYPPSCLYTRPMGNATTVNIILARQQRFPRPSTPPMQVHQIYGKTKCKPTSRPRSYSHDRQLVAPHPSSAELPPHSKELTTSSPYKSSHWEGTARNISAKHRETHRPVSHYTRKGSGSNTNDQRVEPVKKNNVKPHNLSNDRTGTHPVPKLQVVDMARYFNTKHGYQVSETPIVVQNGPSYSQAGASYQESSTKPTPTARRASLTLCESHLAQVKQNDLSRDGPASSDRRHSIDVANIPERSKPQRSVTPVQLHLEHNPDANHSHEPSANQAVVYRRKSPSPVKKGNARRHSWQVTRDHSHSRSSDISNYVPPRSQTPHTRERMGSSSSQNSRPPSRSLYNTPVASIMSSDGNLARRYDRERQVMENPRESEGDDRTGMPRRPEWKRSLSAGTKVNRRSSPKRSKERTTGYTSEGNNREVRQVVPDKTMRIHSAKIKSPLPQHVHQDPNARRASRTRKDHVTSSSGEHQRMLKYTGHHTEDTKESSSVGGSRNASVDSLGNFSTRGLLGVLLASPTPHKDGRESKHRNEVSSRPSRQTYVNIAPFSFLDKSQLCNTTSKSIDVTKVPIVKPKGSNVIQVFDIQKSHDVTSVCLPMSPGNSSDPNGENVDWGKTYLLERKVSDTLKGGNEIAKLRKTPEPVRDD